MGTSTEGNDARILREALEEVIAEVYWFVARKKNLAEPTDMPGRTWADVLNDDLDIGRRALRGE